MRLRETVCGHLDFDRLLEIAKRAAPLPVPKASAPEPADGRGSIIGYFDDSAFCFYYPENLEALRAGGATLVSISSLTARELPANLDALYIGGGFPETHAQALAANTALLASVRQAAGRGLPIYAECGGLMYLSRAITWQGNRFPMAAVLPLEVEVCASPVGHGYVELLVDRENPFFAIGTQLRGHEFHYSKILPDAGSWLTACAVQRGTGCSGGRDAIVSGNVWAAYTHLHALATPEWAGALLRAARFAPIAV